MPTPLLEKFAVLQGPEMKRDLLQYDPAADPRDVARYAVSEVALFLHIPEPTLRTWVSGRPLPRSKGFSPRIIEPADGEGNILSFYNLTEAHILRCTRVQDDVPMKAIRDALDYVSQRYPSSHPLLTQEFATDGAHLFVEKIAGVIENASQQGQLGMEPVLRALLKRIDRDGRNRPLIVYPEIPGRPNSRSIAIRAGVSSGAPVIAGTGVLVSVLFGRYKSGDSVEDLMEDYDLPRARVEDALAYLEAA
jgi:uncharacterized protein (DUF433 family)